jgi:ketosteroid isomerase-like protein
MMTRRLILGVALVVALAIPGYTLAHEGDAHKVMGTVTMRHENHLEVKATDGKTSLITLNEKTKILRGKAKVKVDDIKPGERVVVMATETKGKDGKTTMVATEVRLGAATTTVAGAAQTADTDAAGIEAWLKGYDAAFNAKDLDKLANFYHPDVTIYEGGGINNGWIDYRDRHLGPELKAFENLQFGHSNTKVTVHPGGQSAYATSEYSIKAKMGEREIDSRGLETLVLIKGPDGSWKIRHSHTSSRPARRPAA